jgi:hypothetical protein
MGLFFEDQQPQRSKYYPTLRPAPQKNIIGRINDSLYGLVEGGEYGLTSLAGGILGAGGKLATLGLSKAMTGNADLELGRLVERKINGSMIREPLTEAGKIWQGELEEPGSILGSKPTSVMSFIPDVTTELTDKFINEPRNLDPVSREVVNTVSPFLVPGGKAVKTAGDIGTLKKVKTISGNIDFSFSKAPGETYSAVPGIPKLVPPEAGRFKLIDENTPSGERFKFIDEKQVSGQDTPYIADTFAGQGKTAPNINRDQILGFIDREPTILEDGTPDKAIYHFSNEAKKEALDVAEKIIMNYGKYSRDNPITGKFGHKIYFEPESRAFKRLKSQVESWVEYALHSISSKNGKDYNIRFGDDSKIENIGNIESVIKNADSYYNENGKTYYVKRVRDGKRPNAAIVLELSKDGKFEDYRYVTHLPNRK